MSGLGARAWSAQWADFDELYDSAGFAGGAGNGSGAGAGFESFDPRPGQDHRTGQRDEVVRTHVNRSRCEAAGHHGTQFDHKHPVSVLVGRR